MSKDYRLTCDLCRHEWIGQPYDQQYTTKCPECNSEEFQIGSEYRPSSIQAFWIALLVLELLLR